MKNSEEKIDLQLLNKLAIRWGVLSALSSEFGNKNISLPSEVTREIQLAYTVISSNCFSVCEVMCTLGRIEGSLVSSGAGKDIDLDFWMDLLAMAMSGKLKFEDFSKIPKLKIADNECQRLKCGCSD